MKLGEIIYKEAQQEAQKQQQQKSTKPQRNDKASSGKKDEKVVDAEFEEVNKKDNKKSA